MAQLLTISNTILSLRGRMPITNENGDLVYEARGEFSFFSPTWRLAAAGQEVVTIRRKVFSWKPTWLIAGELGEFRVRRKLWSWVRRYQVIGGPFDGAEMLGGFFDLDFRVMSGSDDIARARGKILTLRDTHSVELLKDDPQSVLFTAIVMTILLMDRNDEQSVHGRRTD